jgi:hypothetical protein
MEILVGKSGTSRTSRASPDRLARHASRMALLAGLVLLVGVVVDLGTLWGVQRQSTVQWEFVALGTTTNSYPLLLLSAVLLYSHLVFKQSGSIVAYRLVAGLVLAMGMLGLLVLLLIVTNYFALMKVETLPKEAIPLFRSVLIKAGGLSAVYALALIPTGILGFRLPRAG